MTDWCHDATTGRIADALTLLGACAGTILAALYGIGVL